jgi:Flavodoxin
MKAVVVYESMYGNTHEVAQHIAEGLRASKVEVEVLHVGAATGDVVRAADLLIVGGPTHVHAMTRPRTRKAAVASAKANHQDAEPDAAGTGLREWFDRMLEVEGIAAAAFDTRQEGAKALTGQASRGIRSRLLERGFRIVATPESFIVDKTPQLLAGETHRAVQWGRTIAELAVSAAAQPA